MKLILDTNAYVGFKLGYPEIVEYLTQADVIFISPIMLGELMFGFRNGSRFTRNMEELNLFLSHHAVEIVKLSEITSDRYSRIAVQLKQQGMPIPSNDIWIAALCKQHGYTLLTGDAGFLNIAGLGTISF